MEQMDDIELLREYVVRHSEAAFTTLVERHLGLIYSAALRRVRDASLAEEVAQSVCIALAHKAHTLIHRSSLSGWLYKATRFAASQALRSQFNRQCREKEAARMQMNCDDDSAWESLAPVLDQAMDELREKDREAVLLRFFENKSLERVGAALGISEQAAKKRVARAVEKLRSFLSRRGPLLSAAAIGSLLSANAIQAAPAGLLAATAAAVKGTAVGASTLALVAGTLKSMAWAKVKLAIGWGTGLLLVGGGAVVLFLAGEPWPRTQATGVVYLEGTSTRHLFDDQGNELPLAIKDEQGNVLKPGDTVDFSLWLSGCRWVVRFDSHLGLPGSFSELTCDGTNIYAYVPGSKGGARLGGQVELYENAGSVWPGVVKPFNVHPGAIWWTYCSACILTEDGPVPDVWQWGPVSGPGDMTKIDSKLIFRQAATKGVTQRVGTVAAALYRDVGGGRPDAIPTAEIGPMATAITNGITFVTKYRLSRYKDSRTMQSPNGPPELLEQFDIALSKFGVENSAVSFVPKMLGRTMVNDYRSSGMKNYITDHWLDIEVAKKVVANLAGRSERSRMLQERMKTHAGQAALSFRARTIAGEEVSFPGQYKGKLVLLDFWATWCAPCVAELPNLTAAYEKYHDQGLEILGVSLDKTNATQKLAIFCRDHKVSWPQLYDATARSNAIATQYHVDLIPAAILVDGDSGLVVSEGEALRGEQLSLTLEQAMAAKRSH